MHLIEHKKGYLCGAANREGESYTDWRAPYIDRSGLLMIYESNSRSGKYAFVFLHSSGKRFPGQYLKTSPGDLEAKDEASSNSLPETAFTVSDRMTPVKM